MDAKAILKGKRVLIVDDHALNIFALETALNAVLEVEIQSVHSGKAALELLAQADNGFDIVLMDMMMPEMNGYEATEKIRDAEKGGDTELTIIAVTARAMQEDHDKCLAAGVSDYICKPVNLTELIDMMAKHCDH